MVNRHKRYIAYISLCLGFFLLVKVLHVVPQVFLSLRSFAGVACFWTSICLLCICILVEYFYSHRHEYAKNPIESYRQEVSPFYFDIPTSNDMLGRKEYARLLVDKIFTSFYENRSKHIDYSFVIHIGEHYGHGKTSFLMMLGEELNKSKHPVIKMNFEPWLCETEAGIVCEFFEAFRIEVGEYLPKLNGAIKDYMVLLLSSIECKHNGVTLKLNPSYGSKRTLKNTHDEIQKKLCHIDRPIIITIDDVDRLQNRELMMILKIIRDTADFPNVFYVVAADNLHLKQMLLSLNISNPENYLKKFFNLEFQLPADENVAFKKLLDLVNKKFNTILQDENQIYIYITQIEKVPYMKVVFSNMREVYRFVNAYFLAIDSKKDIHELNLFDMFLLTMIQMLNLEYYMQLRDNFLNILDIVHLGNDILLQWKGEYNIVQIQDEKDTLIQIEEVAAKDINKPRKEKHSEDVMIPKFENTIEDSKVTQSDIIPILMNMLFGKGTHQIQENSVCRHNMYFKYFTNVDASYMVSKMEVIDMLYSDEKTYRDKLIREFELNKDNYFLSEFMHVIPNLCRLKETEILKKFFIYVDVCYHYKRFVDNVLLIKSLAGYEGYGIFSQKLYPILCGLYGSNSWARNGETQKRIESELDEFCMKEQDINLLFISLTVMSNSLGNFIFGRKFISDSFEKLVDRLFDEKILNSKGELGYQEIDTIIQIRSDISLDEYWTKKFEAYLKDNKEACLTLLSKLVIFNSNGNIEWNWHYRKAILDDSALPYDNILAHLIETYPNEKEIFAALLFLHNHFHSLQDVSGLNDNAFVKMAKERNVNI